MSIYDDLADSGYLDKNDFRKHLQLNSQFEGNQGLKLQDFNNSGSAKVNQEENFSQYGIAEEFRADFGKSAITQNERQDGMHSQYQGPDRHYLQYSSNNQPSLDSKLLHSDMQDAGKLAKEDLLGRRNVIAADFDEDQFERDDHRQLDDDIIHVQTNNNMETGRFPHSGKDNQRIQQQQRPDPFQLDQYRQNNNQLQQILMQLQLPNQTTQQQQRPSNLHRPNLQQDSQVVMEKSALSAQSQYYQQPLSHGSGPNHQKLNKDNSILEIAKMQNSNASNSDNYQNNQSMIVQDLLQNHQREYSPVNKTNYPMSAAQLEFLSMHNPTSLMLNSESVSGFPQYNYPPAPSNQMPTPSQGSRIVIGAPRQVSEVDENINSNNILFQIPPQQQKGLQHSRTMLIEQKEAFNKQQPQLSKTNFYKQYTEQEVKKREIMNQFDDIPIKLLNKNEAYQQQQVDDDNIINVDEDSLSIMERIEHPKWKTRMKVYKEISELFYDEYARQCQNMKFEQNPLNVDEDEDNNNDRVNPFDIYGPLLQKIISDTNLVAQYEGLNCLNAYVRFAPDIRQVIFMVHAILLEKIQHNKPNLKDMTMKILLMMIKRDKSQTLSPELYKRFRNKNIKIASFSSEVAVEAFKENLYIDEISMKAIFKACSENVGHTNKELKDISIELIKEIYKHCQEDANVFIRNLKSLRPIQLKEVKDILQDVEKTKSSIHLFNKDQQQAAGDLTPKKNKNKIESDRNLQKDIDNHEKRDQSSDQQEIDLLTLIPENFNEIPYITQINIKKKGMETFNTELEKLLTRKSMITNKDYSLIFNVVTHMLEDSNALVFMEAIKAVEFLSILLGKNIKQQKLRQFIALLSDKYKETKSATVQAVNKALSSIIKKQSIPLSQLFEYMICQLAVSNKNPRVKQLILEKMDLTLTEDIRQIKEDDLLSMFKIVKDKLTAFIQKDTNAGVRDASVSLLITFKTFLYDNAIVIETINTLPKYRVTEINKLALERQKNIQHIPTSSSNEQQSRPISAKIESSKQDIIGQLRRLSSMSLHQINTQNIVQEWDEALEILGEEGVKQQKPLIIATVHQILLQIRINVRDNPTILESLLVLLKKIFCIERSVTTDQYTGYSKELDQAIEIALYGSTILENKKQVEALLNVLISTVEEPNEFLQSILRTLPNFQYQEYHIEMLDCLFKWLAIKCDYMLKRGVVVSDFEELRSVGLQFINEQTDQQSKSQIIQILVSFKNAISLKQQAQIVVEQKQQIVERPSQVIIQPPPPQIKSLGQQILDLIDTDFEKGLLMIKSTQENPTAFDFLSKELVFNKLLSIVSVICSNQQQQYQQAYALKAMLWMREESLGLEDSFKFATQVMTAYSKSEIEGRDNSVELYLLNHWVRDFSLRDLIDRVSNSSVKDERYFISLLKWLLNNKLSGNSEEVWAIEDFRKLALLFSKHLRSEEVIDFITQSVDKFGKSKVRDFMEIQLMHYQNEYNTFIHWFTLKFGQDPQESRQQSSEKYKMPQLMINKQEEVKVPKKYEDSELREALISPHIQNLNSNESQPVSSRVLGSAQQMDHSKLYKQLREQRKFSNQKRHGTDDEVQSDNKYDQIISRLEAQLQNNQKTNDNVEQSHLTFEDHEVAATQMPLRIHNEIRPSTRSTSRGDQNTRYIGLVEDHSPFEEADDVIDAQDKLRESSIKQTHFQNELQQLEQEKRRIENERELLLQEKNKQSIEWQKRYDNMATEHEDINRSLKQANQSYMQQVGENEQLKQQLKNMQMQHQTMIDKFAEFEKRLQTTQNDNKQISRQNDIQVVSEENMAVIRETFNNQITEEGEEANIGIKKIQELLLSFTDASKNMNEKEIGEPLYIYYQSIRSHDSRFNLVKSLHNALDQSEDVLYALPFPTYKAVLDFTLKAFAQEKAKIEDSIIRGSIAQGRTASEQNEITVEIQKIVSKLLNSKEFTTSLVTLIDILREQMPDNLFIELQQNEKQHLKVILRCISRISKALPSENPDLVRSFDVLIEMQKLFQKNPPESLREDLPCLEDFDLVYRGLKDVADKMMELQPDKVRAFLEFVITSSDRQKNENAFIQYMCQVMGVNKQQEVNDDYVYQDDENEY